MMIGAVEENIFVDPDDKDDLPEVLDDFDYDCTARNHRSSP